MPGADGEPDQGVPRRPVCRPDLGGDDAGQHDSRLWFASMAYVLLCALHRIGLAHTVLAARQLRHDPPQAPEDRRFCALSAAHHVKVAMASACPAADAWRLRPCAPDRCPRIAGLTPAEPPATKAASPSAHGDDARRPKYPLSKRPRRRQTRMPRPKTARPRPQIDHAHITAW